MGVGPDDRLGARSLWTLLLGNSLVMVGIGFFVPILPLYLAARHGSPLLIGFVYAAAVLGSMVAQYPGGWLADRWGSRPVLVLSVVVYGLLFPLYLLPVAPEWLIALRFVHALAAGAYLPAATAMVADLAGKKRGRAFGHLRASQMAGFFLGPAIGGFVAMFRLDAVFLAGGLVCLAAAPLLLLLPRAGGHREEGPSEPLRLGRLLLAMVPVIAISAPVQWSIGTYDTVWSLYLTRNGATPFYVGLSFAAFSLPVVLLSSVAGSLADRFGHLRVAAVSSILLGAFALAYPFVTSVPVLIALCVVEGAFTVGGGPALLAAVSALAPRGTQGRTQGVYQTVLNAITAVAAVGAGALYGQLPAYAFFSISVLTVIGVGLGLWVAQHRRARDDA